MKETQMQEALDQKKALERKCAELEKENKNQKKALERKCVELEKENKKLKDAFRETSRKERQSKLTALEEDDFLKSRKYRLEDQNLVKKPLFEHMHKVNYIYDIKNQWCTTNKTHFGLSFPGRFQRAPALDIRDQATEEREAASATNKGTKSGPKMSPVKLHFGANTDAKQDEIKERMRSSLAAKRQRDLSSFQKFAKQQRAPVAKSY
jgi:hypothetical protein